MGNQPNRSSARTARIIPIETKHSSVHEAVTHELRALQEETPSTLISENNNVIEMPASRREARAEKREIRKKAKDKAKAEKAYNKMYGDNSSKRKSVKASNKDVVASSSENDGGPRAAVYKAKMGSKQKKSQKLQKSAKKKSLKVATPKNAVGQKGSGKPAKARMGVICAAEKVKSLGADAASIIDPAKHPKRMERLTKPLVAVALCVICMIALYGPAKQYYQQMRETDRLQTEYAAVTARSDYLQDEIDTLRSSEGVEDRAHKDLGYVMNGEQTASVKGLELEPDDDFESANVAPGSVSAPETWYSPVLDVLFGYSK